MRNKQKFQDLNSYHRARTLSKLVRFVDERLTDKDDDKTFLQSLGATQKQIDKVLTTHRIHVFSKNLNQLIEVFTDNEYGNYYRIDRILQGKVKAFPGKTPKMRIINALLQAINEKLA